MFGIFFITNEFSKIRPFLYSSIIFLNSGSSISLSSELILFLKLIYNLRNKFNFSSFRFKFELSFFYFFKLNFGLLFFNLNLNSCSYFLI